MSTPYLILFRCASLGFILTSLINLPLFFILKKIKSLQVEREEGPASHKKKSGTPTMGGIGFVVVTAAFSRFILPQQLIPLWWLFLGYAAIGFGDDFLKISRRQNQGLSFWQKIILQTFVAAFFSISVLHPAGPPEADWFYLAFSIFVIVGGANAANLTDGLDGLLAGAGAISLLCFGFVLMNQFFLEAASFSFLLAGSLIGFLIYNFPKARLFMGDVGSLPVGAALSGLAVITRNELTLIIVAGLFIAEAISVIIQVVGFKMFGTRLLRMAPLHHHFELVGWTEINIVVIFWQVSLILGLLAIWINNYAL